MFNKSILVLLKSGLKIINSYNDKMIYETGLEYILDNYVDYILNNKNSVLKLLNDNGELIYFATSDIYHIITLDTPEKHENLSPISQVN